MSIEQAINRKIKGNKPLSIFSAMDGKPMYPNMDWRFNEFPNAQTHNLCITAIELMALPRVGNVVGRTIYELVLK